MRKLLILLISLFASASSMAEARHFPVGADIVQIPKVAGVRSDLFRDIAPLVKNSIAAGYYPGAVILAGHDGKIIYSGVFGNRRIVPTIASMRADTIFDLASLTKVVATTPAIMQLEEQGKLSLDAPVATYWPGFAEAGKKSITVRELLTHTSGLAPDIDVNPKLLHVLHSQFAAQSKQALLQRIIAAKPLFKPGTKFLYSDLNFITLAYLVEIISHEPFNEYVQRHIFIPLKMSDTGFLPPETKKDRIAPTDSVDKQLRWGEVEDPDIFAIGGVGGSAGLFSTARDLSKYAQCLLDNGKIPDDGFLLGPLSILKMTRAETPPNLERRGLGWDVDSYFSGRGILFSNISYGHTGWTGTSLWIDPETKTYLIILTSRLHPTAAKNNMLIKDRRTIANIIAASITNINTNKMSNTGKDELLRAYGMEKKIGSQ